MAAGRAAILAGLALASLFAVAAWPAEAGPLEPTRPSQIVQLRTFGTQCASGFGTAIDLQTRPDGSVSMSPFVLPAKQVLVVQQVSVEVAPGAGQTGIAAVELGGNLIRTAIGVGDASGTYSREFRFEPGLVVSDVSRFCATLQGVGSVSAYATGFLARDK